MFRIIDFIIASFGLIVALPLMVFIFFALLISKINPIFKQKRLGKEKKQFVLYKFRSMKINTKSQATHLVSSSQITTIGNILRKSKLDELPQLWNVIKGEMSLVGPRPCLPDQNELILLRIKYNVFSVRPGITGLSQINSVDMSAPDKLVKSDVKMIQTFSLLKYFYYIFMTVVGKGSGDRVKL